MYILHIRSYFLLSVMILYAVAVAKAQSKLYNNEFDLNDIELLESPFRHARDMNIDVLLNYDMDRLLAPYMKAAGLEPKAESFPHWDGLDGHIGGHYLSALAIHYAATKNTLIKERIDYMLSQLAMCAAARGDGYVGGVPNGDTLWDELCKGNADKIWGWWAPWYNVHKMYAGLRDCWIYTDSKVGRNLFLGMCDWGISVISNLDDGQMERMLGNEFGGMGEIYADAYAMTGDNKYLDAAKRFTHHWLFDSMRDGIDNLDNCHANTQIPKAVAYQRVAELSGDIDYTKAAQFFWDTVVNERTLSFGGNSRREHFASASDAKSYVDAREGPESCNTYNMLKLTEGLFRMNPEARFADYYERALYNHILSTQHPEHGGYVYFTSARPGHYRVYSRPNSNMWCCVGTGMENHGKYGQFIYTHIGDDSLMVNLFIPSVLRWKDKDIILSQRTNFPADGKTHITVSTTAPKHFCLSLRHPGWSDAVTIKINGQIYKVKSTPSSYIAIDREWHDGDEVEMDMSIKVKLEELNHMPEYVSVMRGPIVMAARFDNGVPLTGLLAEESFSGHIALGPLVSVFDTPLLIGNRKSITKKLESMQPVNSHNMTYTVPNLSGLLLEPFYNIHDSRYIIYWLSMSDKEYKKYLDDARNDENKRLALDYRTIDAVNTGEQQPETDHSMEMQSSISGIFNGEPWREASDGGFFSFRMKTDGASDLTLRVRYWGNESGKRKFNISVDNNIIATEDIAGKWCRDEFVEQEYQIPNHVVNGKDFITVKFSGEQDNTAGGVFHIRLLKWDNIDK